MLASEDEHVALTTRCVLL